MGLKCFYGRCLKLKLYSLMYHLPLDQLPYGGFEIRENERKAISHIARSLNRPLPSQGISFIPSLYPLLNEMDFDSQRALREISQGVIQDIRMREGSPRNFLAT